MNMLKPSSVSLSWSLAVLRQISAATVAALSFSCSGSDSDEIAATLQATVANGQLPALITTTGDSFSNRCVSNSLGDINALTYNPTYFSAYFDGHAAYSPVWAPFACPPGSDNTCDTSIWPALWRGGANNDGARHRQGVQRVRRNGQNFLFVSNSVRIRSSSDPVWNRNPGFEVVQLGSTSANTGTALRGNIAQVHTAPPTSDHVQFYQPLVVDSSADHGGGLSVMGDFLSVALYDATDTHPWSGRIGSFQTYNISNPVAPSLLFETFRSHAAPGAASADTVNSIAGIATIRLSDSRFLAMGWGPDSQSVEVFVTPTTNLSSGFSSLGAWPMKSPIVTGCSLSNCSWPSGTAYQGFSFVAGCNGALYLVGTLKTDTTDWVDLWQVTFANTSTMEPRFRKLGYKALNCQVQDSLYCNFDAAAGAYVDPNGRIIIYATEHWNDALPGTPNAVKFREFAPY